MPLGWNAADCRRVWESGVPLLPRAPAPIVADDLEELLAVVMERLAVIKQDAVPWLQRVAEAWDQGAIAPAALFPTPGGVGARIAETIGGATTEMAAFLAYGSLRPALEAYFAQARSNLGPHDWGVRRVPVLRRPGRVLGRARGRPEAAGVPSLRRRLVLPAHEVPNLRERTQ